MNFELFQKWLVSLFISFSFSLSFFFLLLECLTSSNENLREKYEILSERLEFLFFKLSRTRRFQHGLPKNDSSHVREKIVYYFSKYSIPLDNINFIFSDCILTKENISTITDIVFLQRENFYNEDYLILMNLLKQKYSTSCVHNVLSR